MQQNEYVCRMQYIFFISIWNNLSSYCQCGKETKRLSKVIGPLWHRSTVRNRLATACCGKGSPNLWRCCRCVAGNAGGAGGVASNTANIGQCSKCPAGNAGSVVILCCRVRGVAAHVAGNLNLNNGSASILSVCCFLVLVKRDALLLDNLVCV